MFYKGYFINIDMVLFKVNNRNTRKECEIFLKLTIKLTPEWSHWHCSGVLIVNFEHISRFSGISTVDFEETHANWEQHHWTSKCLLGHADISI